MVHKIKKAPMAYRVYMTIPSFDKPFRMLEQRQYLKDAEIDKKMLMVNPLVKKMGIKPFIKKERAEPSELFERKILKFLRFKKWSPARGALESFTVEF